MDILRIAQGHGIEQHRTQVEEVAVHQAAQQQNADIQGDEILFHAPLPPEQLHGLVAVEAVGRQAHHAAGGCDLDQGIVPPGREEGAEGGLVREVPGHIFIPGKEEASTKNRVFQELFDTVFQQHIPLRQLADFLDEQGKHIQQLLEENCRKHQRHRRRGGIDPKILLADGLFPQDDYGAQAVGSRADSHCRPGAGEQNAPHQHRTKHIIDPALFLGIGQVIGKGHHHGHQAADVIVHAPAGINQLPVHIAGVGKGLAGDIGFQKLGQHRQAHAHAHPAQVILGGAAPIHRAGEQEIQAEHRRKLQQGEQQIAAHHLGIALGQDAAEQVGPAQKQHAGHQAPLLGQQSPAQSPVVDQAPNQADRQDHRQRNDDPAAVADGKDGIAVAARVIAHRRRNVAQHGDGHQGEKIVPQQADVGRRQNQQGIDTQIQGKHIGQDGQRRNQDNVLWGAQKPIDRSDYLGLSKPLHKFTSFSSDQTGAEWYSAIIHLIIA